jgi:branched-chain amino acid transport system substrate-binding protein
MPMSTGTKRILAIAVVAVIVVAGVGVYLIMQPQSAQWVTPGVTGIPPSQWIKVGVLDPMTAIQGKGSYQGSWLAAYEINKAGGVSVNHTQYYFALASEDTSEADAQLDTSKGVSAASKMITVDGAQFLTGGFRTESLQAYLETVVAHQIIFINTGSATDSFCNNTLYNYAKYKYFFRIQPLNSTSLATAAITELAVLKSYIQGVYHINLTKWAVIREDLDWTKPFDAAVKYKLPTFGYNATPTDDIAFPLTATSTDFTGYMNQIQSHGAQIIIPVISAGGGALMDAAYNSTRPHALIFGIDVESQLDTFWNDTNGACQFELNFVPSVKTNKTALTLPFWNNYVGNFSRQTPLYTSFGGYDAIYTLAYAINNSGSFLSDRVITSLETINTANPRVGSGGVLAWTRSHDLYYGKGFGVPVFFQWQSGGARPCVSSGNMLYPNSIVTGIIQLPPQGLNP